MNGLENLPGTHYAEDTRRLATRHLFRSLLGKRVVGGPFFGESTEMVLRCVALEGRTGAVRLHYPGGTHSLLLYKGKAAYCWNELSEPIPPNPPQRLDIVEMEPALGEVFVAFALGSLYQESTAEPLGAVARALHRPGAVMRIDGSRWGAVFCPQEGAYSTGEALSTGVTLCALSPEGVPDLAPGLLERWFGAGNGRRQ